VAVVVAEPMVSGTRGLRSVVELAQKHGITPVCVINKHDVNPNGTARIKEYLSGARIELLGTIPFSPEVSKTIADCGFVVDLAGNPAAEAIRRIVDRVVSLAGSGSNRHS
jgi:MinD superfamily P-loop ATPase